MSCKTDFGGSKGGDMLSPGGGAGGRDLPENVESDDDRSLEGIKGACEMAAEVNGQLKTSDK